RRHGRRGEPGPEHDVVRRRIPGCDAQGERVLRETYRGRRAHRTRWQQRRASQRNQLLQQPPSSAVCRTRAAHAAVVPPSPIPEVYMPIAATSRRGVAAACRRRCNPGLRLRQALVNLSTLPCCSTHAPGGRIMRHESILDTVGHTPAVRIRRLAPTGAKLYVKLEAFNPMGSVKDRLALGIIEDAE